MQMQGVKSICRVLERTCMQSTRMYTYIVWGGGEGECTQSTGMCKIVHKEQAYDDL